MADNVIADAGSGGATFGTFSDGSEHWPGCALVYVTGGSAGNWTVQKVDATHGLPVAVTGGTLTSLTNITGTISLPTGAATVAKQPALGTAGTASADVITVQGVTSMTPLLVTLSGTNNIATVTTVSTVTSVSQWAGTAIDTNSGTKSAGTLRVVLATDQPALTNKLLVTPDLPSGASTAAKQPALGTAGTASADVITIQGIASMTKLLVTPDANSAVNVAQINGVTVLMGNGASGTGAQRVTIANDSTGVVGLNAGTNLIGQTSASAETATLYSGTTALTPKFATISCASSGDNTLVAGVSAKKIRVLALSLFAFGTALSVYFREDTAGTAIFGDGTNKIPLDKTGAAGAAGFSLSYNPLGWMQSASSKPLVLNLSTAQGVAGLLTYVEAP